MKEVNSMNYWWVNHKQTFKEELEGGYIWSPQVNSNGSKNQTYLNLKGTKVGDIVFSYANSEIKAVGLVVHNCKSSDKPEEFGVKGDGWDKKGWLVQVDWEMLSKQFIPKNHLKEIVPLLPIKYSPIQSNGNGNQGCYLAAISNSLGEFIWRKVSSANPEVDIAIEDIKDQLEEEFIQESIGIEDISETEKQQLVKSRRGQGVFKKRVAEREIRCRVTGVENPSFLIASHIKPWKMCSNAERLDGDNGLLLSPHVDRLFDRGWISFPNSGDVVCFNEEVKEVMKSWNISHVTNVEKFSENQMPYLEFHRAEIFKGTSKKS